jgi:hypothetical protein
MTHAPGRPARTSSLSIEESLRAAALDLMLRHPRLLKTFHDAMTVVRRQAGLDVDDRW